MISIKYIDLSIAFRNLISLKAQQGISSSKASKKKITKADAAEENPEDYVDPETSPGEKKRLSCQMAKQFSPAAVEKSLVFFLFLSIKFKFDVL